MRVYMHQVLSSLYMTYHRYVLCSLPTLYNVCCMGVTYK